MPNNSYQVYFDMFIINNFIHYYKGFVNGMTSTDNAKTLEKMIPCLGTTEISSIEQIVL